MVGDSKRFVYRQKAVVEARREQRRTKGKETGLVTRVEMV
jgi:hypothetical protein